MTASSSKYRRLGVIFLAFGLVLSVWVILAEPVPIVRFATFDASLTRSGAGQLARDLAGDDQQAKAVAEIIQRVTPDVLLLCGFDRDEAAIELFLDRYLGAGQNGAPAVRYAHRFTGPVNAADGFPGRDGMVLLSRYPILTDRARTFHNFAWRSMPAAEGDPEGGPPEGPLTSKGHWDVPIQLSETLIVHVLASHPSPPAGSDPTGARRHRDEIRFWADYVLPDRGEYARDDAGASGPLEAEAAFVIMGGLGADPVDGASLPGAISQLLDHPGVQSDPAPRSDGAVQQYRLQWGVNSEQRGDPSLDTADFDDESGPGNLRVDYVLPAVGLRLEGMGVFWPERDDPWFAPVGVEPFPASAHRLVWVDVGVF